MTSNFPQILQILAAAGPAAEAATAAYQQVELRLAELRKELEAEHNLPALRAAAEAAREAAATSARQAVLEFASRVWQGEFGPGSPVLVVEDFNDLPVRIVRLARVVGFGSDTGYWVEERKAFHLARLNPEQGGFLSWAHQDEGPLRPGLNLGIYPEGWQPYLVEVAGDLSPEEVACLLEEAKKLARDGLSPENLIEVFGEAARFEPGERYYLPEGRFYLLRLPTGRWARYAPVDSDREHWRATGVTDDPTGRGQFKALSDEEVAYLLTINISTPRDGEVDSDED